MTMTMARIDAGNAIPTMNLAELCVRRIDAWQQRHRSTAFAFGVIKKSGDDRAGSLAALIAYYGFLALFPLLLLLTTAVGFVLEHHPAAARAVLHSALADFPIIGDQLRESVHPLRGSGFGLAIGFAGLMWGSLGAQCPAHAGRRRVQRRQSDAAVAPEHRPAAARRSRPPGPRSHCPARGTAPGAVGHVLLASVGDSAERVACG